MIKKVWILGLFLATAALFSPSLRFGFLNWDDPLLLTERASFLPLTWKSLLDFFSPQAFLKGEVVEYYPLRDLSYAADLLIWGWSPLGFHLMQVLLHALNAVLLAILASLFMSPRYALLAAALFAWHPLTVEPVAWISSRKDLLLGCFFLLTVICVKKERFGAATTFSISAQLSKITAVTTGLLTLPTILTDSPRRKRSTYTVILLLIGLLFVVLRSLADFRQGILTLPEGGGNPLAHWPAPLQTVTHALLSIVWPVGLSARYAQDFHLQWFSFSVLAGTGLLAVWVIGIVRSRHRCPSVSAGLFLALVAFLPHLPILPTNIWMADRYLYLTLAGISMAAAGYAEHLEARRGKTPFILLSGFALFLGLGSFKRLPVWHDSLKLWSDTVTKSPGVYYVWTNLGVAQMEKGWFPQAVESFYKALELDRNHRRPWIHIARIQADTGRSEAALASLATFEREASAEDRDATLLEQGLVWAALGKTERAEPLLRKHLARKPKDPTAWTNLGVLYASTGREALGLEAWNRALKQNPEEKAARFNRARFYFLHKDCGRMNLDLSAIRRFNEPESKERNYMVGHCGGT